MNRKLKMLFLFMVEPKSLILVLALFNFEHIWVITNTGGGGMVSPWYSPWSYTNEPSLLLVAAIFLRINHIWANCVSCILSGYLLGYFVWLFAIYPEGIRVGLHYEWLSLQQQPFIESWDAQYLFALIIFCFATFCLARAALRGNALRRTANNKALPQTA